jgi:serine/threonine protein kinase
MTKNIPEIIGKRYRVQNELGEGGMGIVYRAYDRLTGQTVALKMVTTPSQLLQFSTLSEGMDFKLALAQEFKTLASLRHPHIISVLDYGFEDGQPYYTMELLENPRNILQAGRHRSNINRIDLIIQVVQALAYLHRRGIIHRDLKADNVLVGEDGQVQVVDFGLATARDFVNHKDNQVVGTLSYIAPEVLMSNVPASEAADMYALGVIAYQLLAGRHPFDTKAPSELIYRIVHEAPEIDSLDIDERLKPILAGLLTKMPENRITNAAELIQLLVEAVGGDAQYETASVRESFLQAAQFVGRDAEVEVLSTALSNCVNGQGSAWLIGGESGVGKSRLLDELRTLALVQGADVLRGQAIVEGGAPYLIWREVIRYMCLQTYLNDLQASVIKEIIPDINNLLERSIPDAPDIDPQAAQNRLITVVEDIFRQQSQPIVILLEDLHWSGADLAILSRINRVVGESPILIIGSYRHDERPRLPEELPDMQTLTLERLTRESIADLSASILGEEAGKKDKILNLLERETEGNVFFIVEVIRALAEEAGQLDQIGRITLPETVFAHGMKTVVQRRLSRVPDDAKQLLDVVAVAGRQLDLKLIANLMPKTDITQWLSICSDAAVLDVLDDRWRFAHDKLREGIIDALTESERAALHKKVAEAIEITYPNDSTQFATLAYHWGEAGSQSKETHYATEAGLQAFKTGNFDRTVTFLNRAIELADQIDMEKSQQAFINQQLGDAHYNLGHLAESLEHSEYALAQLALPLPKSDRGFGLGTIRQLIRQLWHRVRFSNPGQRVSLEQGERYATATRACLQVALSHYFRGERKPATFFTILALNLAEKAGEIGRNERVRSYSGMTLALGLMPNHRLSGLYRRLTDDLLPQIMDLDVKTAASTAVAVYEVGSAQWERAEKRLHECNEISLQVGNMRRWEETTTALLRMRFFQGNWMDLDKSFQEVCDMAQRLNDTQYVASSMINTAEYYLRRGDTDACLKLLDDSQPLLEDVKDDAHSLYAHGLYAQVYLQDGDLSKAQRHAKLATTLMSATPTAYFTYQGYVGASAFYLSEYERNLTTENQELAKSALNRLNGFAKVFNFGKPRSKTYEGLYHQLQNNHEKAQEQFKASIAEAQQLNMPYEEATAHYHLGRLLSPDNPNRNKHLNDAIVIFERLGAMIDANTVTQLLHE